MCLGGKMLQELEIDSCKASELKNLVIGRRMHLLERRTRVDAHKGRFVARL